MLIETKAGEHGDISQRTMTGSAWMAMSRFVVQGLSLIQITVLARMLNPEAFGLIGLAFLAVQAIGIFVNTGYDHALVQKTQLEWIDVDTAWWVILARYLIICGCLLVLAQPIALLYQSPEAIPVLVAIALIQPIYGLVSPSVILLRRGMQFRRIFKLDLLSSGAGLIVGIAAALIFANVWALVAAYLTTTITLVLLSYQLHPYRPHRQFSWCSFRLLSGYGQWVLGSAVLSFVAIQGSSAFAGWMFGVAALGIYQMASRFALLASTQLGEVVLSVETPAYAKIQDNRTRVSGAFLRTVAVMAIVVFGLTTLIALSLPALLVQVLGGQWIAAAALLPAIAIAGGLQAMLRVGSSLFLGIGHPRYQFFTDLAQAVVIAIMLYPLGILYGLLGLPLALVISTLCAIPICWFGVKTVTNCTLRGVLIELAPALLGASIMILIFVVGMSAGSLTLNTVPGVVRHLAVTALAGLGFLTTIAVSERVIPQYSPLTEFHRVFSRSWRRSQCPEIIA
jgi:PST family polysaccharide transporter/lipopolysaccharide exporter